MIKMAIDKKILLKYDIPGPRYTSYPTAPEWSNDFNETDYSTALKEYGKSRKTLSLYIHIPFCQSLCTFCACSVIIRKLDRKVGDEYLDYLSKEMDLVVEKIGRKMPVKQLHFGGGTPTYFDEEQLERLMNKITESFDVDLNGEIAIEIDPRTIDESKVKKLKSIGFNRVSMGIQDFDEKVQNAVNRIQPLELVKRFDRWCRELNFESINYDLIYGLPFQTVESFQGTVDEVAKLRPDRIALYSFAYVPWLKKHQQKIPVDTLPSNDEKIQIFLNAREKLLEAGYMAIAMDHFALEGDELSKAFKGGLLYRNFMGYTVKPAEEYIGLGITSIGFLEKTFIQNQKTIKEYYASIENDQLPAVRGKRLNEDDIIRQWTINALMCQFKVDKTLFRQLFEETFNVYFHQEQDHLARCVEEGLLSLSTESIEVTELGKLFIRNICTGFDYYLRQKGAHKKFSQTV